MFHLSFSVFMHVTGSIKLRFHDDRPTSKRRFESGFYFLADGSHGCMPMQNTSSDTFLINKKRVKVKEYVLYLSIVVKCDITFYIKTH